MSRPTIISIEGNIGAGKTTIVSKLHEMYSGKDDIIFLPEPVHLWENIKDADGENIIQKFYGDNKKYSFPFQVMAYATRLSMLRNTVKNHPDAKVVICERSLDADKHIFAQMLHDDGMMDDIHFEIYKLFFKEYYDEFRLDHVIYIDATAEKCHERISKRSRDGESNIPLDYLKKCKKYHDTWLIDFAGANNIPVLHLNTNEDVEYKNNDNGIGWLNTISELITNAVYEKEPDTETETEVELMQRAFNNTMRWCEHLFDNDNNKEE